MLIIIPETLYSPNMDSLPASKAPTSWCWGAPGEAPTASCCSTPVWVHKQQCFSWVVFYVLFTAPAWIFMFFLQHTCVSTQTTVLFLRGFICSFYSSCVDFYVLFTAHLCEYTNKCFSCVVFYVLFTAPAWIVMFFLQHTCVSTQTTVLFLRGFLCSFYSSCVDFYVLFTAHLCEYTNNGAFPAWFFMFFLQLLRGFLCYFYSTPVWVHKQRCFSCVVFLCSFYSTPVWVHKQRCFSCVIFHVLFTAHLCEYTNNGAFPVWFFMFLLQHTCVSTQTTMLFLRDFLCSFYSSCVDFYVLFTAHLCEYTNNGAFPACFFLFFLQLLRGCLCSFYSTPVWVHKQQCFSCVVFYVLFTAHLCEYTNNGAFPAWFFMFFLQLLRGFLCSFYSTPVWVHKRCFSCVVFYVLFTAYLCEYTNN